MKYTPQIHSSVSLDTIRTTSNHKQTVVYAKTLHLNISPRRISRWMIFNKTFEIIKTEHKLRSCAVYVTNHKWNLNISLVLFTLKHIWILSIIYRLKYNHLLHIHISTTKTFTLTKVTVTVHFYTLTILFHRVSAFVWTWFSLSSAYVKDYVTLKRNYNFLTGRNKTEELKDTIVQCGVRTETSSSRNCLLGIASLSCWRVEAGQRSVWEMRGCLIIDPWCLS